MKEENCAGWGLCLYGFFTWGILLPTQCRDIGNWSIKIWFYGLKGQSAGFKDVRAAGKYEDNSRKKRTTEEEALKSDHKYSSVSWLNPYSCMRDLKMFSKEQQLKDKTTITTTHGDKVSSLSLQEREFGFVSCQDYFFFKQ